MGTKEIVMEHDNHQPVPEKRGSEPDNILQEIQNKLQKAEEENRRLRWAMEGMKRFSMLVANRAVDKNTLYYELTGLMVRYVKAGYGNLYIMQPVPNSDSHNIEIIACYAYGYKKGIKISMDISEEGLIRNAVKQATTICTTNVPQNYPTVFIGVYGSVPPKSIIALPLLLNGLVYGVIEIASLRIFEPHEISLLEEMTKCVASVISSEQLLEKTKNLLEESQIKVNELLDRHKKMQQNMKELRTIQRQILSLQSVRGQESSYRLYLN